jgi:hypothetical protein
MNLELLTGIISYIREILPNNNVVRKLLLVGTFFSIVLGIYRNIWMILFFALLLFMLFGTKEYFSIGNIQEKMTNLFDNNLGKTFVDYVQKIAVNIINLKENKNKEKYEDDDSDYSDDTN